MADMLVVKTGHQTLLGKMADQLQQESTPDAFELGVKNLGQVLTKIMLFMVLIVLTVNIVLQKPTAQGLLFALALAVGLTPELLPAIITVTLSKGAMKMAQQGILVRHIRAINNLGSMNILCTDKTGTLTEGNHAVEKAVDTNDLADPAVLRWAALNATFQHGVANPMDAAILSASAQAGMDLGHWTKLAEIPYDYDKRRVCIQLRDEQGQRHWICKGALESVMPLCTQIGSPPRPMLETDQKRLRQQHAQWAEQGLRALAVTHIRSDEAQGMTLLGFVLFSDPPKIDSRATLAQLHALGVEVKMLTGDHPSVAVHIARAVGLQESPVLTGADVDRMSLSQLSRHSAKTAIFAVLTPQQKEKVIHALRSGGHVTAYLGDGMNDALALHSADVGISVSNAVDVARDAADVVLVANSLKLLTQGIVLGRESFANTLKYILSTMSANFGNMLSMAVASLLLPFPPLLASQILLNNLLSDVPGMGIANDSVDEQWIRSPRQWNTHEILENMFVFAVDLSFITRDLAHRLVRRVIAQ
jgi:Mg2+-importing ATPase